MKPNHPVEYDAWFILIWGIFFSWNLIACGPIGIAYTAGILLMLVWHEHSHAEQCLADGGKIQAIRFTWFGGYVIAEDTKDYQSGIRYALAGVANTWGMAIGLIVVSASIELMRQQPMFYGANIASNMYMNLLNGLIFAVLLTAVVNSIPFKFRVPFTKDFVVGSDAMVAWMLHRDRFVLWPEEKIKAIAAEFAARRNPKW